MIVFLKAFCRPLLSRYIWVRRRQLDVSGHKRLGASLNVWRIGYENLKPPRRIGEAGKEWIGAGVNDHVTQRDRGHTPVWRDDVEPEAPDDLSASATQRQTTTSTTNHLKQTERTLTLPSTPQSPGNHLGTRSY